MMTPKAFATLERLVELRRQKAAMNLGRLKQAISSVDARSRKAQADANPAPQMGPVPEDRFQTLALFQRWEHARQQGFSAERAELVAAMPAAEEKLRRARATVQAMELLAERVDRAEKIKQARREEVTQAANAIAPPDDNQTQTQPSEPIYPFKPAKSHEP